MEMREGGIKKQAQQFPVRLELILSSDCLDSEQSLPGGARAVRDHSDLAGAPPGTEEHLCETSGHCVSFAGQIPWIGDARVVGVTEVEALLHPSLVLAEGKQKWKNPEWLLHLSNFGMKDFIIPKFEKTFGK